MELARIEQLLEAYFEGNTSLAEEATLRSYFTGKNIAPEVEKYQPLFAGLEAARKEVSNREIKIPSKSTSGTNRWWYGIAASAVIALTVAGIMFSEPSLTKEEQEALTAFQESKEAMLILSENLNKGVGQLALVDQFTETKNRILK